MSERVTDPGLSNPFSTGGGGETFEQLVGTSYLVALLAGDIPRGLDGGTTKEVKFQQRYEGSLLDDVVVTSNNGSSERKLAIQIKHDLTFSDNEKFARVIDDCWKTYTNTYTSALGRNFDPKLDRIGIGIGVYQTKISKHLHPLLEWARTSNNSEDFFKKVFFKGERFSSNEKQEYLEIFKKLLSKSKGEEINNEEVWKFLKCLVVIHFELEYEGSRDLSYCWNRLRDLLKDRNCSAAKSLFNNLSSIVEINSRSAGSLDRNKLITQIQSMGDLIALKEYSNFTADLDSLSKHTNNVLECIRDTIGEDIRLPRTDIIETLEDNIKNYDIVIIAGEPMVGKSVLLKMFANRLRSEGEIIAFSIERFSGTSIENFLHNINVNNNFNSLLFAAGMAPLRCVFIDGLENAIDENKRRILNDLLIQVKKYNEQILSDNWHKENCWKLVITSRKQELKDILPHLNIEKCCANDKDKLKVIDIDPLNQKEIQYVSKKFPRLKDLIRQNNLKEILSIPLVLDMLTRSSITLQLELYPETFTESWLYEWFWKDVVKLANGAVTGRGNPEKREQLLLNIGEKVIEADSYVKITNDMNVEALSGLKSDKILYSENNKLRFYHDSYKDWTLTTFIKFNEDKLFNFLSKNQGNPNLVRPFRLYCSYFLEVEHKLLEWVSLVNLLTEENSLSPRWQQIALEALLYSPLIDELLIQIKSYLFQDEAILLTRILKLVRTVCTEPAPWIYSTLSDLPADKLEKYLAFGRIPIKPIWSSVIKIALQYPGEIKDELLKELSYIFEDWMINTKGNEEFRKEIALKSLYLLDNELLMSYENSVNKRYMNSFLWAADLIPESVSNFVRQKVIRNENKEDIEFEEFILEEGWKPLCMYLPALTVEVFESLLCTKIDPDVFKSEFPSFMYDGIRDVQSYYKPTCLKGPFLSLLRIAPQEGLKLIHIVVNHATKCWMTIKERENSRKPIAQIIKLTDCTVKVWGDEQIYRWYRYLNLENPAVTCSLMALERWMNERIKEGDSANDLFELVLKSNESVAIVGVCTSVALANVNKCLDAAVIFLENPSFWDMDSKRCDQDMTAESSIESSAWLSYGSQLNDDKILLKLAREPHRQKQIQSLIPHIMDSGSKNARSRLCESVKSFPKSLYFFYEDETKNENLIKVRAEFCKNWSMSVKNEKESIVNEQKNKLIFKNGITKEFEEGIDENSNHNSKIDELMKLKSWSLALLDEGVIKEGFTIDSAILYVQSLVNEDYPIYQHFNFFYYSELKEETITSFAAAVVTRHWEWVEVNGYQTWFKEQLLIAVKKYESNNFRIYNPSMAKFLPSIFQKYPEDENIKKTIFALASSENREVRNFLFDGLKALWSTYPAIVWKCIEETIEYSKRKVGKNKFSSKSLNSRQSRIHTLSSFSRGKYGYKDLKDCTFIDIEISIFSSIFYCFPLDYQIRAIGRQKKLTELLHEILTVSINHNKNRKRDCIDKHSHISQADWNLYLYKSIANSLLRSPKELVEPKLCKPILDIWEDFPFIMKNFLRGLIIIGSQDDVEERFVHLWLSIGDTILSSETCKHKRKFDETDVRKVMGLLIFTDQSGVINWKVNEWKPLEKMTPLIEKWCNVVGSSPYCFPSLVRLLETIGSILIPTVGINWLEACLLKVDNYEDFFKQSQVSSSLAELLYDTWTKQKEILSENQENFLKFSFIVDLLAHYGEGLAIQLQKTLMERAKK